MTAYRPLLQELLFAYGPCGQEDAVRDICLRELAPVVDEAWTDPAGNVIGVLRGGSEDYVMQGVLIVGGLVLYQAFFGHIAHERGFELDWRAVALVSSGLIAQLLLVESLGWIIATTLLFVAGTMAFASRRLLLDALIGVALTGLTFLVFNYGLGLTLPVGSAIEQLLPAEADDDAE